MSGLLTRDKWNYIRIPVEDIREAPATRELNPAHLAEIAIFTVNLKSERTLFLDHIRLE